MEFLNIGDMSFGGKSAGGGPVLPWDDTDFVMEIEALSAEEIGIRCSSFLSYPYSGDITWYDSNYQEVQSGTYVSSASAALKYTTPSAGLYYAVLDGAGTFGLLFTGATGSNGVNFLRYRRLLQWGTLYFKSVLQGCFGATGMISVQFDGMTGAGLDGFGNGFDSTFKNCTSLVTADLTSLNLDASLASIPSTTEMFSGCSSLSSANLAGAKLAKITTFGRMFYNCLSLVSIDMTGTDISGLNETNEWLVLTGITVAVYDDLLDQWLAAPHKTTTFMRMPVGYTNSTAHDALDAEGWTFFDGGFVG